MNTDEERTPYDGRPFYCGLCGAGFGEYMACDYPCCTLESAADAQVRKAQHESETA